MAPVRLIHKLIAVLDEADYLGDNVAILQAPGKLLALDNPVGLKHRLGKGFSLAIDEGTNGTSIMRELQRGLPAVSMRRTRGKILLSTGTNDVKLIRQIVDHIRRRDEAQGSIRYQINSSTLEDVFLDLNADQSDKSDSSDTLPGIVPLSTSHQGNDPREVDDNRGEKDLEATSYYNDAILNLTPGHKSGVSGVFVDAWTIVRKRLIILRRSWLLSLVSIVIVICAACIPLFFLGNRAQTCALETRVRRIIPLTYPRSYFPFAFPPLLVAPETALGDYASVFGNAILAVPDNATFVQTLDQDITNLTFGGISINPDVNGQSLFAWEGSAVLNKGLSALNLVSNALLDRLGRTGGTNLIDSFRINLDFQFLPSPSFLSTAQAMKWIAFL